MYLNSFVSIGTIGRKLLREYRKHDQTEQRRRTVTRVFIKREKSVYDQVTVRDIMEARSPCDYGDGFIDSNGTVFVYTDDNADGTWIYNIGSEKLMSTSTCNLDSHAHEPIKMVDVTVFFEVGVED